MVLLVLRLDATASQLWGKLVLLQLPPLETSEVGAKTPSRPCPAQRSWGVQYTWLPLYVLVAAANLLEVRLLRLLEPSKKGGPGWNRPYKYISHVLPLHSWFRLERVDLLLPENAVARGVARIKN